jgi:hypothetical protein
MLGPLRLARTRFAAGASYINTGIAARLVARFPVASSCARQSSRAPGSYSAVAAAGMASPRIPGASGSAPAAAAPAPAPRAPQQQPRKARTHTPPPAAADVAAAAVHVTDSEVDMILQRNNKRKGRKEIPDDPQVREAIRRRIAESRVKRATRLSYKCPACSTTLTRAATLVTHADRCCPDILDARAIQRVRVRGAALVYGVGPLLTGAGG